MKKHSARASCKYQLTTFSMPCFIYSPADFIPSKALFSWSEGSHRGSRPCILWALNPPEKPNLSFTKVYKNPKPPPSILLPLTGLHICLWTNNRYIAWLSPRHQPCSQRLGLSQPTKAERWKCVSLNGSLSRANEAWVAKEQYVLIGARLGKRTESIWEGKRKEERRGKEGIYTE